MSAARFLQGIYDFEGDGLAAPALLDPALVYTVPEGNEAQLVYFRGGNSCRELVCAIIMRDGEPIRYFPIGAHGSTHVALRVVEDLLALTRIEIHLAAPSGVSGQAVIDVGLVEI
ncbi:MAG: molybdopterin oxidoreductase [Solirubrobacterales bacterium]|nr:molybdopterin oxidoreductase [Solirubrobacterales bacterium]